MAEYKVISHNARDTEAQLNALAKEKWEPIFMTAVPPFGSSTVPFVIVILKK